MTKVNPGAPIHTACKQAGRSSNHNVGTTALRVAFNCSCLQELFGMLAPVLRCWQSSLINTVGFFYKCVTPTFLYLFVYVVIANWYETSDLVFNLWTLGMNSDWCIVIMATFFLEYLTSHTHLAFVITRNYFESKINIKPL